MTDAPLPAMAPAWQPAPNEGPPIDSGGYRTFRCRCGHPRDTHVDDGRGCEWCRHPDGCTCSYYQTGDE